MAKLGPILVACPRCGNNLPPLDVKATFGGRNDDGGVTVLVEADPGPAYVRRVMFQHPHCFGGGGDGEPVFDPLALVA